MEYKASLDRVSKTITGFITVLFLGIISYQVWLMSEDSFNLQHFGATIFTTVLLIAIYGFCYLFRPIKYLVANGKIIIKRPFKDVSFDISNINDVFLTQKDAMKWTLRTFGNGGLFGYFGYFRNGAFGNMTWYATKRSNYLLFNTRDHETIVLTPDNPEMINEIKKEMLK